jgi:hypothetical protein
MGPARSIRIPAVEIESMVQREIEDFVLSPQRLIDTLLGPSADHEGMERIATALSADGPLRRKASDYGRSITRIVVGPTGLQIGLATHSLRSDIGLPEADEANRIIEIPCRSADRKHGAQMRFGVAGGNAKSAREVSVLAKAVVNARDWMERILRGEAANQRELATQTGYDERYISQILPFAFLAPDIIEEIIDGTEPTHWSLKKFQALAELDWHSQRSTFGMSG